MPGGNHDVVGDDAVRQPDAIADGDPIPAAPCRSIRALGGDARRRARGRAAAVRRRRSAWAVSQVVRGRADVVERARRWEHADRAGSRGRQLPDRRRAATSRGSRRIDARERGRVRRPARRRSASRGAASGMLAGAVPRGTMPANASEAVGQQGVVLRQVRRRARPASRVGVRLRVRVGQAARSTVAQRIAVDDEEAIGGEQGQRAAPGLRPSPGPAVSQE